MVFALVLEICSFLFVYFVTGLQPSENKFVFSIIFFFSRFWHDKSFTFATSKESWADYTTEFRKLVIIQYDFLWQ